MTLGKWIARTFMFMACCVSAGADATIIFTIGNNPQPDEENILLNSGATGTVVSGTTTQTNEVVDFSSSSQLLSEPVSGQARIEAVGSSGSQVSLTGVTVSLANGGTFTDLIFNPNITGTIGTSGGTATVGVNSLFNGIPEAPSTFAYVLSNGQNFVTIVATSGETIQSVRVSYPLGFTDLRQIRISGVRTIPEPSSALLAAFALLALAVVTRRGARAGEKKTIGPR